MAEKKKYSVKDNPMYYITWKDIGKKDRICLILLVVALVLMLTLAVRKLRVLTRPETPLRASTVKV